MKEPAESSLDTSLLSVVEKLNLIFECKLHLSPESTLRYAILFRWRPFILLGMKGGILLLLLFSDTYPQLRHGDGIHVAISQEFQLLVPSAIISWTVQICDRIKQPHSWVKRPPKRCEASHFDRVECGIVGRYNVLVRDLKMEAVGPSEMLTSTSKSTRRYNPEHQHRHLHRRDNLTVKTVNPVLELSTTRRWLSIDSLVM